MEISLQLYQVDFTVDEKIGNIEDQLLYSVNRLLVISERLAFETQTLKLKEALFHLEFQIENYLYRAYEMRERVILLAGAIYGSLKFARTVKRDSARTVFIDAFNKKLPGLGKPLYDTIIALEDCGDIKNINNQVGSFFIKSDIVGNNEVLNTKDLDLTEIEPHVRNEMQRIATAYQKRIEQINTSVHLLIDLLKSRSLNLRK
jgi:hypothetical protein